MNIKLIFTGLLLTLTLFLTGCMTVTRHVDGSKSVKFHSPLDGAVVSVYKDTTPYYYSPPPVVVIDRSHYQSYGVWGGVYIQNGYGHGYGHGYKHH